MTYFLKEFVTATLNWIWRRLPSWYQRMYIKRGLYPKLRLRYNNARVGGWEKDRWCYFQFFFSLPTIFMLRDTVPIWSLLLLSFNMFLFGFVIIFLFSACHVLFQICLISYFWPISQEVVVSMSGIFFFFFGCSLITLEPMLRMKRFFFIRYISYTSFFIMKKLKFYFVMTKILHHSKDLFAHKLIINKPI